jgi:hypothetical protein
MEEVHRKNIAKYQSNDSKASVQQLINMNNFSTFKPKNFNVSIAI